MNRKKLISEFIDTMKENIIAREVNKSKQTCINLNFYFQKLPTFVVASTPT